VVPVSENGIKLDVLPTVALTTATRESIVSLCNGAWGHDPEHEFAGLFDLVTDSMHVLAYENEVLVAHACWADRRLEPEGLPPLRTAYVDAVATEPVLQGRGIGSLVMQRFAREAADYELNALSSERAPAFYERLNWERWRGPTGVRTAQGTQPTPDDIVLILRTQTTPVLNLDAGLLADNRPGQPW
jgi:aminoglycoside 2'-N-acetyltransferase I